MADSCSDCSDSDSSSLSTSSNCSSSYGDEFSEDVQDFHGIKPWRFEPRGHSENEDLSDEEEAPLAPQDNRLQNSDW